ncbi:alpha/beta hydrolase [Flavobacterium sp. GT3R68]|nr:alpha/beta hydrolase [Flavobacterium sp. GT3R68]RTY86462.1 alpha/beta hydrolase [Flavobacterium sp. GSN2]TRW91929.1 alpha/beta hydrolase [Flavobacterium sp. GT3R68]
MEKTTITKKETVPTIPRPIIIFAKTLRFLSERWATLFLARLFTTPIKHKMPKRELEMDRKSKQELLRIPTLNKKVMVYNYGSGEKTVLLVHGWSGRGTQLVKFAQELVKLGYCTISFDAPAHGKSPGTKTIMTEFIASVMEIEKKFGPFEAAIGHSLGGMTLLNALKRGLQLNKVVIIGSGDKVQDIITDFVTKLELTPESGEQLKLHFEKQFGETMESYSSYIAAKEIDIPVLVIHDENDYEVPVQAGIHIHKQLRKGDLLITKGLGHRKILGNHQVIEKVIQFINN